MTTTAATATRYYVARTNGTIERLADKAAANGHADALYSLGVVAPIVVAAVDRDAAADKANRCYRGQITCRQARDPRVK